MISAQCSCGEVYQASEEHRGRRIRCRKCAKVVELLSASPAERPSIRSVNRAAAASPPASQGMNRHKAKRATGVAAIGLVVALAYYAGTRQSPGALDGASATSVPASHEPVGTAIGTPNPLLAAIGDSRAPSQTPASDPFASLLPNRAAPAPRPVCQPDPTTPSNSEELIDGDRGGYSTLTVDNRTGYDAVVVLFSRREERIIRQVYVRNGYSGQVLSIPPGFYSLRFALGDRYATDIGFCGLRGASEFDRVVEFKEIHDSQGVRYSANEITLHKVVNGNAPAHSIDPSLVFGVAAGRPD